MCARFVFVFVMLASFRVATAQTPEQPAEEPPVEASPVDGETSEPEPEPRAVKLPAYQTLPQNENWSVLRQIPESERTDFWDPIKYIPLTKDGSTWLSFGGSTRFRLESWWNFNFGAAPPDVDTDDTFLLWRLLLHADLHVGEHVRVFAEGITAQSTDRTLLGGNTFLNINALDLQQGFLDLELPLGPDATVVLRGGRQELLFARNDW